MPSPPVCPRCQTRWWTPSSDYELSQLSRAIAEVDRRPDGTCELSPCASLELTLALAREKGIPHVLVLDSQGERTVEA